MDPADIAQALRAAMRGEVDEPSRRRAEYSSDASNYRVVPQVVAFPRDTDDILAAAEVSRRTGTPLTTRGACMSIAGNAVGAGIVLDTSRHLGKILDLDPGARAARVEPGVILASLQVAAAPHGLRFGPDPLHPVPGADAGRDDRQQRVRRARPGLRPHRRQRA